MNADDFLKWLEVKNYLSIAKNNSIYFKKILTKCLDVKKDEDLLIIGDEGLDDNPMAPIIAGSYYFAAKDMNINTKLIIQKPKLKGDVADPEVVETFENMNRKKVIALALSYKLGKLKDLGQSFRSYAFENYHRFVSSPSLGKLSINQLPHFIKAINVDYDTMKAKGEKVKAIMDHGKDLNVTTEAGTDLYMSIDRKESINNCGDYCKPRTGGNVPAGEVYTAPRWKNVEGKVVIDGSSSYRYGTQLIKDPITLTIEKDEVVNIKGGKEAENLQKTIDWAQEKAKHPWGIRRVGEFGVGINPNASIIGTTIIDEKSLGTSHVAIGSNYWFGGTIYAIIHLDQVFKDPKIEIDGELLKV